MSDYWSQFEGKSVPLKGLLQWLSDEHDHVTDDEGELLKGWDFPVVNSMDLERWAKAEAVEDEFEYAVEETKADGGSVIMDNRWTPYLDNATACKDNMVRFHRDNYLVLTGKTWYTYKVVKRPKPQPYTVVEDA
jgi:hypothetical protein